MLNQVVINLNLLEELGTFEALSLKAAIEYQLEQFMLETQELRDKDNQRIMLNVIEHNNELPGRRLPNTSSI